MELSSFQLELMEISPHIALLLNITPNHLDRHKTMDAYTEAKANILDHQRDADVAVLGREDPIVWDLRDRVKGDLLTFGLEDDGKREGTFLRQEEFMLRYRGREEFVCHVDDLRLRGAHNLKNALAACAVSAAAGFSVEAMEAGIRSFKGLPHRLEFVRSVGGVDWYNDSIATSPERAIAAMQSFNRPLVLLAGGKDKNLPWEEFAEAVPQHADHVILFGEAARKINNALRSHWKGGSQAPIQMTEGLDDAVTAASRVAQPGDVVLLAPGGTSFDEFTNFEERGEHFRTLVEGL
jgi:UDP-N-acetylmuramoylalanine--D-glutamate ligase